jgi:hypothetical protein
MNPGGGCNPGVGINTGDFDPKVGDWTTADQATLARDPQVSGYIGNNDGTRAGRDPWPPVDNPLDAKPAITAVQGADINDTVGFVVANAQTVADATATDGTTSVVNKTGMTVPSGGRLWGPQTVAAAAGNVTIIEPIGDNENSPARIGVEGAFNRGDRINVYYKVDGGDERLVAFDVLQNNPDLFDLVTGLAQEFTVDPDVQGVPLRVPVIHVALWAVGKLLEITRVELIRA